MLAALDKQVEQRPRQAAVEQWSPGLSRAVRGRITAGRSADHSRESRRRDGAVPDRRHAADDGAARRDARDRARDGRGGDGHDLARRGLSVVAQAPDGGALVDRRLGADGARDGAADDRLGDHLAVHAPSGSGRDGRPGRAGGRRAGPVHRRVRDVEDLPQQHEAGGPPRDEAARATCATRSRSCAACSAASGSSTTARRTRADIPALSRRRTLRAGTCPSTSRGRRR